MIVRYMRAIRYAIPFSKLYRDTDTDRDRVSVSVSGYKLYPIPTSLVTLFRYIDPFLNVINCVLKYGNGVRKRLTWCIYSALTV